MLLLVAECVFLDPRRNAIAAFLKDPHYEGWPLACGFLPWTVLEWCIHMVVYDSDIQRLAGGLAHLPDLVSALLVNYSRGMI